jgi:hypothetical protein
MENNKRQQAISSVSVRERIPSAIISEAKVVAHFCGVPGGRGKDTPPRPHNRLTQMRSSS